MKHTVFYSWQKDTPDKVGFDFVGKALADALTELNDDYGVERAPREFKLDRDTKDVAGQPAIVDTIFKKVASASIFVPDMTVVGTRVGGARGMQNPNVLIEYGYAVRALGHERIVAVMNTHFGDASDTNIPFDMKHLRWPIQYCCAPNAGPAERKTVRKQLTNDLKKALSAVIQSKGVVHSQPPFVPRSVGESMGRFRSAGTPLGVASDPMDSTAAAEDVTLADGPVAWFRIYPEMEPAQQWTGNQIQSMVRQSLNDLRPFNWLGGIGLLRASDGYGVRGVLNDRPGTTNAVSFAFTNGEVWACLAGILGVHEFRGTRIMAPMFAEFKYCLEGYARFLMNLGVPGPFRWQAGFEGTKDLRMVTPGYVGEGALSHPCLVPVITGTGTYTKGDNAMDALRPFFVSLFDCCGLPPPEIPAVSG